MFNEQPNFSPELGQMLLSNNNFYSEEAYWATEGLILLDRVIEESKIREWNNQTDYEGTIFAYRKYCWCDGDRDGHGNGCPPNFEHYPSGVKITWYKHEGRGVTCNGPELPAVFWWDILNSCVQEIKEYEFN